jgi:aryl-alcohol dehydrogenase-like predicted oxidoreductase
MERRVLPGTGLDLSVVGFGAWAIGGEYWGPVQDAESIDAIHAALDLGINWFDTAPIYGSGHSDTVLAAALRGRPEALIFTKVGPRPDPETGHVLSDLTPDHVMADCEASLQRLGTERIALLQVHWPCELGTPMADTIGALDTLVSAGKVERYGLCNYPADTLSRCLEFGSISSFQTPYSMIRREFEAELRTVVMGRETPVGVLVYETLCRGLLTGKYGPAAPTFDDDDLRSHDDRFRQPSFGSSPSQYSTRRAARRLGSHPPGGHRSDRRGEDSRSDYRDRASGRADRATEAVGGRRTVRGAGAALEACRLSSIPDCTVWQLLVGGWTPLRNRRRLPSTGASGALLQLTARLASCTTA